ADVGDAGQLRHEDVVEEVTELLRVRLAAALAGHRELDDGEVVDRPREHLRLDPLGEVGQAVQGGGDLLLGGVDVGAVLQLDRGHRQAGGDGRGESRDAVD